MKEQVCIFLCDRTGNMAKPWAEAGYTCYCVDLQHLVRKAKIVQQGQGKIIYTYGDARYWTPPDNVEIIFVACFPVCTDMAGSGAQDYSNAKGRTPKKGIPQLMDGLMLFNSCYQVAKWSGAPFVIENPVGVIPTHFRKPDYYFQPWQFGDLYTKKTALWTGNGFIMPKAEFIYPPEGTTQKIWLASPGEDRADIRAETPEGFARAVFESNCKMMIRAQEVA
jgi:hypothetical protein